MTLRTALAVTLALASGTPALAQHGCPQQLAIYTEKTSGYELRFRSPAPWEAPANVSAVLELVSREGLVFWGTTWMPNGTSWNQADLFYGCKLPGPLDEKTGDALPGSTEEELDKCRVWKGLIYQLVGGDVDYLPFREDPAAKTILLTDLGPSLHYSGPILDRSGEPHDVFTLSGCAE
jgi:hypothetical protein